MTGKRALPIFVIIVILTATLPAQTIAPDTVFVTARVTGSKQQPALGLKADNFQILEDGVEQKVSYVSAPSEPWDMRVLLYSSVFNPPMRLVDSGDPKTADRIRAAYIAFKSAGNSRSRYVVKEQPTSLVSYANFGVDSISAPIGSALMELDKSANPRRAIIVVTDGYDAPAAQHTDYLLRNVAKFNIPIYIMFFPVHVTRLDSGRDINSRSLYTPLSDRGINETLGASNSPGMLDPPSVNAQTLGQFMSAVVERTGGEVDLVKSDKLAARMVKLAMDMNSEYVLGFKSTNAAKDGSWRKLKITVKSTTGEKLKATFKDKYFVSAP